MSASDYTEAACLNSLFGKTSNFGTLSARPTLYVTLCTAAPTDASTGSTLTEVTYTGYARVATAATDWNAASGTSPTTITNANAISFTLGPSGMTQQVATHFALCDASSAGNVILWGALNQSLTINQGITPSFSSGQLSCTCD